MAFGLRLSHTTADRAGLAAVSAKASSAFSAEWIVFVGSDDEFVVSESLADVDARGLAAAGHDVVELRADGVVRLKTGALTALSTLTPRRVQGLLAALRPLPAVGHVVGAPVEAVFVVDNEAESARLLERLLLLGRHDSRVCDAGDGRTLMVRVTDPPVWLLLWCADEAERGVRAFVRHVDDATNFFTESGWWHPLGERIATALQAHNEIGLMESGGHLRRSRGPWPETSIHDALAPTLPPTTKTQTLQPAALTQRFPVQVRLGASLDDAAAEGEFFVVDDDGLFALESFVESASSDELARLLVSRVSSVDGRSLTVVREAVRPGVPRLGARLSTLLGQPGWVRVAGHDGLYLPPQTRLVPQLRRDDLRKLLALDGAAAVVVDEDADGLRLRRFAVLTDEPMHKLVSFLATARRIELDRLVEEAVFTFPGLNLTRPKRAERERVTTPKVEAAAPPPPKKPPPRKVTIKEAVVASDDNAEVVDIARLTERERDLEDVVVGDNADDAAAWAELAAVKSALEDADDAAACAGVAAFLDPAADVGVLARGAASDDELVALCVVERPTSAQARRLCGMLLARLKTGRVDDAVVQQAQKVIIAAEVPVSRRLQWATLRAIHQRSGDAIGATRAKEAVIGALNVRGLTEALDLPRFVRQRLALGGGATHRVQGRGEQLAVLERLLPRVVEKPLDLSLRREALLKAIFLNGLARLGGATRDLLTALESEIPAHEGPVRLLLRLYVSRAAFSTTTDASNAAAELWKAEVARTLDAAERIEDRKVAEWLIKRSRWLRTDAHAEPPLTLRPALEKLVGAVVRGDDPNIVDAIARVVALKGCYDFEVAAALERLLDAALRGGRDDIIEASATAALRAASALRILAHRARLLGVVVRSAASIGAADVVERALDDVAAIAADRNVPSTRDLLLAVRPALFALRRLGALDAARRFLNAFEPLTRSTGRETGPLAAALAEGFHLLGDNDEADELLRRALERATGDNAVAHVDRYEAGAAVAAALVHWPHAARATQCEGLFSELRRFADTFTTQGWFPTHQLLMAENLVECLIDDATVRTDRLQAYLDQDEVRLRRRVLADWRTIAG